jgi:hypothetical protein
MRGSAVRARVVAEMREEKDSLKVVRLRSHDFPQPPFSRSACRETAVPRTKI